MFASLLHFLAFKEFCSICQKINLRDYEIWISQVETYMATVQSFTHRKITEEESGTISKDYKRHSTLLLGIFCCFSLMVPLPAQNRCSWQQVCLFYFSYGSCHSPGNSIFQVVNSYNPSSSFLATITFEKKKKVWLSNLPGWTVDFVEII